MMGLASLDPVLTLPGGGQVRLATHEWASGAVDPRGHELLASFELRDGLPCWRWRVGEVVLERRLAMRQGHASVAVVHTLLAGGPVGLTVEAAVHLAGRARRARLAQRTEDRPYGRRSQWSRTPTGSLGRASTPTREWYVGAHHREEAARGLAAAEDLLRVGRFTARLDVGETLDVSAWAGDLAVAPPPAARGDRGRRGSQ